MGPRTQYWLTMGLDTSSCRTAFWSEELLGAIEQRVGLLSENNGKEMIATV